MERGPRDRRGISIKAEMSPSDSVLVLVKNISFESLKCKHLSDLI